MERQFRLNWNAIVEEAKQRRKAANLTQERIAALADVSTPTVSRFEGGKKDIQLSSALNLLRILGMTDERILVFEKDSEIYDPRREVVIFLALQDKKSIHCEIAREALIDFFGATSGTSTALLQAFRKHRKAIEHKTLRKYLANQLEPDNSILISPSDLG